MQNHKNRKLNRLKKYDYSQDGWYFITICVKNRECFFGEIKNGEMQLSKIGAMAQKCWLEIPAHFSDAVLDEFIIMPNHIHGIIVIENPPVAVGNNNHCSVDMNNNHCSVDMNNNHCFDNRNNIVGNKNFCSQRYYSQPTVWQTKWARSLSSIVRGFKIGVTKWCRENNAAWNNNYCSAQFAWQKSYYDHIIRNEKSLGRIREYIKNNPIKWEFDRNNSENLWM